MANQDDLSRRRRLNNGCCPTHGIPLVSDRLVWRNGHPVAEEINCPRRDCDFRLEVGPDRNAKVWSALLAG
jgi:hypothetical protein